MKYQVNLLILKYKNKSIVIFFEDFNFPNLGHISPEIWAELMQQRLLSISNVVQSTAEQILRKYIHDFLPQIIISVLYSRE